MLQVEGLRAGYGAAEVLLGIDMLVEAGEVVGLVGANGAGKTTLVRCLAGLLPAQAGSIKLGGSNLTGVPASLLDGSTATASLTYSTQAGRRNEFIDYGLSMWAEAIAGRLSQDDVVPRGQHTVLDMTDWLTTLPDPTGPKEQD